MKSWLNCFHIMKIQTIIFFNNYIEIDLFYLIFNDLPPTNCSCRKHSLNTVYIFYNKLNKLPSTWAGLLLSSQGIALVRSCAVARIIAAPPHRKTIGLQSKDNHVIKRWGLGSDFTVSRLPWNDLTEHLSQSVYILTLNEDPKL